MLDIEHGCDDTRICRIPADLADVRAMGGSFIDEGAFYVADALRRETKTAVKNTCYRRLGPAAFHLEFLSLQRRNRGNLCCRLLAGRGRGVSRVSPFEFLRCAGFGPLPWPFPAGMTPRKRPERERAGELVPVCAGKPRALLRPADRGNGETECAVEVAGAEIDGSRRDDDDDDDDERRSSAANEAGKRGKRSGRGRRSRRKRSELRGFVLLFQLLLLLLFRILFQWLFQWLFRGEFQSRIEWKFDGGLGLQRRFQGKVERTFERLLRGLYVFLAVRV